MEQYTVSRQHLGVAHTAVK